MKAMHRCFLPVVLVVVCMVLTQGMASAGSFEDAVRARWRGAWVVVGTEVYSSCMGRYDTNKVSGTLVTNRGGHRFLPGELGKVQKVQLKKKKVEFMITLDVRLLVSYQDGPFTLYNDRACAVSLEIQLPRQLTKTKNVDAIDRLAGELVARFDTLEAVRGSGQWNGRETDPYPDDYELTLAYHAAWRAEQTNLAIDQKRQVALEQVKATGKAIDDDPDYLEGLAAGVGEMRRWKAQDCGKLMARSFDAVRKAPPEDRRGEEDEAENWRDGYEDGQRLVYGIVLMERLEGCYVPVPPVPGETEPMGHDLTSARIPDVADPR